MKEIWRPIKGYEGFYEVSNFGNIRNLKTQNILHSSNSGNGYLKVALRLNNTNKYFLVHRLVAQAFLDNPNSLPQINHKDENKNNNNVNNLEWCNNKYNCNYGTRIERYINSRGKKILCIENGVVYDSISQAASILNLHHSKISLCISGKRKHTGGYHFKEVV